MSRLVPVVVALTAIVTFAALYSRGAGPALAESTKTPGAAPKQVIENDELMELFFDPFYVDLRNALKEAPQGRKEWRQVYIATFRLAEVSNLLFSREDKDYMKTPEWDALALESRDAVEAVGEAVKKLDYDLAKERYIAYIETCNKCHNSFELEEPTVVEPFIGDKPQETRSLL